MHNTVTVKTAVFIPSRAGVIYCSFVYDHTYRNTAPCSPVRVIKTAGIHSRKGIVFFAILLDRKSGSTKYIRNSESDSHRIVDYQHVAGISFTGYI